MKTLSRTCSAAGFAALLAFAGTAAANAATITVPDTGTLLADGAGATVSVSYTCSSGSTVSIFLDAAQTVGGNRVATGNGFSSTADCTGGTDSLDVTFLAAGDFVAFEEGTAAIRVVLISCDTQTCEQAIEAGEVDLTE
ncbi:hypothetical protein [Arthrobacter mangrovi]|uniref:C-type lysozyme inhibitor domain-containing protein n=1 Tax=Arthrobacter mangrovi TaxID=2966350 RepID=A0ABQ5MW95_9MICC|nr:hypothetical protein [Arthrobacter mangrovi]GLB68205.1 hypothetical protein AHIS1636_26470 [Arthrobacter mangrovi]